MTLCAPTSPSYPPHATQHSAPVLRAWGGGEDIRILESTGVLRTLPIQKSARPEEANSAEILRRNPARKVKCAPV